jgi:hypothetical protein
MDDAGGGVAAAALNHHARSPEDVFRDFRARRAGIVKALTTGSSTLSSSPKLKLPPVSFGECCFFTF